MSCMDISAPKIQCDEPKVKSVLIINASDVRIKDGKVSLKRKYGKFKRPVYKYL